MTKITEKAQNESRAASIDSGNPAGEASPAENSTSETPTEPGNPSESSEPSELSLTLPEDAAAVEEISATDRLLGFDADGNPTTATAEQIKKFVAAGLVSEEALDETLVGVFKTIDNGINADDAKQGAGYSYSNGTPAHGTVATFKGLPTDGAYGALQLFCDNQEARNARFWVRNNNQQGFTPWRELYHTGNLTPATAASVGLMSASDKIKLNAVASAMSLSEDEPATMALNQEESVSSEISIRAQRSARYQMQTDELLYDALEAFARNHPEHTEFAEWLAAKDRIRAELAKPETQEGGE